ncbi:MAG: XTP/dITP diphosphatase [Pseudomonadota bacterium]
MDLIIATKNKGKLEEIKDLLQDLDINLTSLLDYPDLPEIIEDGQTFLENARIKASAISQATGKWALGDDSGLVVAALNGEPGINSARYAGSQADHAANNEKLLKEMKDVPKDKRQAYFICTMVLISPDGKQWDIEEKCHGEIAYDYRGTKGFGFDPLFYLPDYGQTMAELPMKEKNKISHRGKALRHMKEILKRVWSG